MDPSGRLTCEELLEHSYFDHFREWFQPELEVMLARDARKVAKSKSRVQVRVAISRNTLLNQRRLNTVTCMQIHC